MSTYSELLDDVLTLTDQTGVTPATNIAKIGLVRTLKYISSRVYLPDLVPSATYTWGASDTEALLSTDFVVTDYSTPVVLFVNDIPYVYRDYLQWKQLQNSPGKSYRENISSVPTLDERPARCFTIQSNETLYVRPVAEGDVLELFYKKEPGAYGDGSGTPEMPSEWQWLLVDGAIAFVQAWERNQEKILPPAKLFTFLDDSIQELDIALNSQRARGKMRLSHSYRIPS